MKKEHTQQDLRDTTCRTGEEILGCLDRAAALVWMGVHVRRRIRHVLLELGGNGDLTWTLGGHELSIRPRRAWARGGLCDGAGEQSRRSYHSSYLVDFPSRGSAVLSIYNVD